MVGEVGAAWRTTERGGETPADRAWCARKYAMYLNRGRNLILRCRWCVTRDYVRGHNRSGVLSSKTRRARIYESRVL